MLSNRKWLSLLAGGALAALAAAPAISFTRESVVPATYGTPEGMTLLNQQPEAPKTGAEKAAITFVRAMSAKDVEDVWVFASEEDQDAFGTERALYDAYVDTFPALAKAKDISIDRTWTEGDTPFVEALVTDANGKPYRATMGFWLNDAGDFELISCDVKPVSDRIAKL